jgi:hypothetical protein
MRSARLKQETVQSLPRLLVVFNNVEALLMVISPWISMETNHQQWIHGIHPRSGDFPMENDDLTYLHSHL